MTHSSNKSNRGPGRPPGSRNRTNAQNQVASRARSTSQRNRPQISSDVSYSNETKQQQSRSEKKEEERTKTTTTQTKKRARVPTINLPPNESTNTSSNFLRIHTDGFSTQYDEKHIQQAYIDNECAELQQTMPVSLDVHTILTIIEKKISDNFNIFMPTVTVSGT